MLGMSGAEVNVVGGEPGQSPAVEPIVFPSTFPDQAQVARMRHGHFMFQAQPLAHPAKASPSPTRSGSAAFLRTPPLSLAVRARRQLGSVSHPVGYRPSHPPSVYNSCFRFAQKPCLARPSPSTSPGAPNSDLSIPSRSDRNRPRGSRYGPESNGSGIPALQV